MRLRNVMGLAVCGALLGAPAIHAQDRDTQARPETQQQGSPEAQRQGSPDAQRQGAQDARERDRAQAGQADRGQHATETIGFRELRGDASEYYGRTVTFDASVDSVLGPNVVKLGSTSFWDWFGGSIIAYAPDAVGLAVSNRDRVTVTGTAERFNEAELREHLGWIDAGDDIDDRTRDRVVVKIDHITTDDGRVALIREGEQDTTTAASRTGDRAVATTGAADRDRDDRAVGTTGRMAEPFTTVADAFDARRRDVGRQVNLQQVQVERMLGNQFFLAAHEGDHMLVKLPEGVERQNVQAGQRVSLQGIVMQMPDDMRRLPGVSEDQFDRVRRDDVYVMATNVRSGTDQPGAPQQQRQPDQQQPGQQGQQPGAQPQGQQPQGQPGQPGGQPQGQQPGQPERQPEPR
jgi:hypothetical protein